MYRIKNVMKWAGALALVLASSGALAQAIPAGAWKGSAPVGGTSVRVDVTFKGDVTKVHFGSPFDCGIDGKYTPGNPGAAEYRFGISASGGEPCNHLSVTGRMVVTPLKDKTLRLTIDEKTRDGVRHWQADLGPAAP